MCCSPSQVHGVFTVPFVYFTHMNTENKDKPWDVTKATRDVIIGTAASMQTLKKKTNELAQMAEKKWQESKPNQQKAKDEIKKVATRVASFGKGVGKGIKEGIAQVQKEKKA